MSRDLFGLLMHGVFFAELAEFFDFQTRLDFLFIFRRKIIDLFTRGALKLDKIILRHIF